jgi:hypothetical protein
VEAQALPGNGHGARFLIRAPKDFWQSGQLPGWSSRQKHQTCKQGECLIFRLGDVVVEIIVRVEAEKAQEGEKFHFL